MIICICLKKPNSTREGLIAMAFNLRLLAMFIPSLEYSNTFLIHF